ncbi:MAG: accessory Sec system translocase SecA2 [Acidobacteria bacterium]|nr:accessory Sec system translocase SecA2 [Acidobacteriota bacterium]
MFTDSFRDECGDVIRRSLGFILFPEQFRCAEALTAGRIVEMQTGEGKTAAAVPAAAWLAREKKGVHILTANDYLAQRDAEWMRPAYEALGLRAGWIRQTSSPEARRRAYAADVTYVAATEAGFDYLRDCRALTPAERVQRGHAAAIIDEADCVLIDEARIPLVLAGETEGGAAASRAAGPVARELHPAVHFERSPDGASINLTFQGFEEAAQRLGIAELQDSPLFTALLHALHARELLHRDVDYLVKDGCIVPIDAYKGRGARERRWPAGLHAALEEKEGLPIQDPGRILSSITMQNYARLYGHLCGMTGTARSQAEEFWRIYGLEVEALPTHRPMIREDRPDRIFLTAEEKTRAIVAEIHDVHATGRPVLIGTASVEASEALSARLNGLPHRVLNASNEDAEAALIAKAGERGAVTISTNMAGRGVDIQLGDGVAGLGGLHVIGASRNDSRRIDHQLRGRAGRQGDPGSSQFFLAFDDALFTRLLDPGETVDSAADCDSLQRRAEGRHLEVRQLLDRYEGVVEGQRHAVMRKREESLANGDTTQLAAIDEAWACFLEEVEVMKSGFVFLQMGGRDPLPEFLANFHELSGRFWEFVEAQCGPDAPPARRGATWTYLSVDMPFGTGMERIVRGMIRKVKAGKFWG